MRRRRLIVAAALSAAAVMSVPAAAHAAPNRICTETLVKMSDGVRLHAWVSRLAPDGPRPVLFMMDSYSRSGNSGQSPPPSDNACPNNMPDDYVPEYLSPDVIKRFTLVHVAYRGTGSSEGLFDYTGPRTQQDIHEAIKWAAGQPWSNGRITLTGESGTGFFAFHALHEPSVEAAIIFTSCADMYRCLYHGGEFNDLDTVYMESTITGFLGGIAARNALGTTTNPSPATQLAALASAEADGLTHSTDDAFWKARSALGELSTVSIPVMYTTDLYDIVQPFDALQLTPNARFNFGMGHQSDKLVAAGGARYTQLVRSPVDRFVAHYGLGDKNGAQSDPKVTLTTNLGSLGQFDAGHVLIRKESSWPLASTRWKTLYLAGGGALTGNVPPAQADGDSTLMVPAPAIDSRSAKLLIGAPLGGSDLSGFERTGLTYSTPPLQKDLEVSGPIALRMFASSTAANFDWSVRIADVWPDGRSEWITDGYLRATLRKVDTAMSMRNAAGDIVRPWLTYDSPQSVGIAFPTEYYIDVIGTSNVFRKGHRLRLDVLPVAAAQLDTPLTLGLGTLTVLRDVAHPSSLMLPVIPNRCGSSEPLISGMDRPTSCATSYEAAIGEPEPPCISTRMFVIHAPRPRGAKLRSARFYLDGQLIAVSRGPRPKATIDLRGRPAAHVHVRIVARTTRGRRVTTKRRFLTCR